MRTQTIQDIGGSMCAWLSSLFLLSASGIRETKSREWMCYFLQKRKRRILS